MLESLHQRLIENKQTLSFAESITGGALAAKVVSLPDCSNYFLGSIVAYCDQAKMELLGVCHKTLAQKGAVSEQTAQEMALGAKKKFTSDFALATTGIAGPSGQSVEKPLGMVCFALAHPSGVISWTSHFSGQRADVIKKSIDEALLKLFEHAQKAQLS